jgi:hypothetical protein
MVRQCREAQSMKIEPATIAIIHYLANAPFCDPQSASYLSANIFGN